MNKSYLVFGAAGHIGREIVSRLTNCKYDVSISSRRFSPELVEYFKGLGLNPYMLDVSIREHVANYSSNIKDCSTLCAKPSGIIYVIGHCPPGGFHEAIKYPLSQLPIKNYQREIDMHQVGVLNVFQAFVEQITEGGCFVFISSAITRHRGKFPPFLQAHYHAGSIDAQDWLVEGMRHDPVVIERKIKIHRLAPPAVDTPFHHGGPKPPVIIPVKMVVDEVMNALESDTDIDKQILP